MKRFSLFFISIVLIILQWNLWSADNQLSSSEKSEGWVLLFNGIDHQGWKCNNGKPIAAPVEDGCLVPYKAGGYLIVHEKPFGDFKLRCEVRMEDPKTNSGVFFRVSDLNKPVQNGFEIQVYAESGTGYHHFGAIYDLCPSDADAAHPLGEWNQLEITSRGPLISVRLNGREVSRINCDDFTKPGLRPDGSKHKFGVIKELSRKGYLGFQDHGHKVWYKNVKILELD
jgi:hypothetical protein